MAHRLFSRIGCRAARPAAALAALTTLGMPTALCDAFPIGTPGTPWGATERAAWLKQRTIKRSYRDEVIVKIDQLRDRYDVTQYGALTFDPNRYPLYALQTREWRSGKPCVLVTGGVHGYEKSGVQGALLFLKSEAEAYSEDFNILVLPCVSPWGYETIQRWNAQAVDPNRSFNPDVEVVEGRSFNPEAATEESAAVIALLAAVNPTQKWICHIDLHETTDTDETEFRPAKAARDGIDYEPDSIPDGFYLVSDVTNPQAAWHTAMIDAVRKVTHIAPPDANNKIIGEEVVQEGVIIIPSPRSIGLCAGVTTAPYATTTEVYPDSSKATEEQCNHAQVACITAALEYIRAHESRAKEDL